MASEEPPNPTYSDGDTNSQDTVDNGPREYDVADARWGSAEVEVDEGVVADQILDQYAEAAEGAFGSVPAFANEANRALHAQLVEGEKRMALVESEVEEFKDRLAIVQEHLHNSQLELVRTQQLVDARNKEMDSEKHLKQLADREGARLHRLNQEKQKLIENEQNTLNDLEDRVFRARQELEAFKSTMDVGQEELEQWALAARQKEEDNLALQRYQKQDEQKMKQLSLQIEKLTKELQHKRNLLQTEITGTQAAQIELDTTAEEFKRLHKERQELITQWEQTISAMQRRDASLAEVDGRLKQAKEETRERSTAISRQAVFLDGQIANNHEVERQIDIVQRGVGLKHSRLVDEKKKLAILLDEIQVARNNLQKVQADISSRRAEAQKVLVQDMEALRLRLEEAKLQYEEKKSKHAEVVSETFTAEERARLVEEMAQQNALRLTAAEKEVVKITDDVRKAKEELFKAQADQRTVIAEINGAHAALKNLTAQIAGLDQESIKQQELVYNQEFLIQQLERKVARVKGERSDEEKAQLNARIALLQGDLDAQTASQRRIQDQLRQMEVELKMAKRKSEEAQKEREKLGGRITELTLDNNSTQANLRTTIKKKEQLMVSQNILRLEVQRHRDTLNQKADEVFGLENRNQQLQLSMEERLHEIGVHKDMLRTQLRLDADEKHKLILELSELETRVKTLEAKYHVVMGKLSGQSDIDGDSVAPEHSQAYYIIKAAQDREDLQRKGDTLDEEVRAAEKELRALERTLSLLNLQNSQFRQSFMQTRESEQAMAQKAEMERRCAAVDEGLRQKRRELMELQNEVDQMRVNLSNSQAEVRHEESAVQQLVRQRGDVLAKIDDQQRFLSETQHTVASLAKEHRRTAGAGPDEVTTVEYEFKTGQATAYNASLLRDIAQLTSIYPDEKMRKTVEEYCTEHGLELVFPTHKDEGGDERSDAVSVSSHASVSSHVSVVEIGDDLPATDKPVYRSRRSSSSSSRGSRKAKKASDVEGLVVTPGRR